MKKKNLLFLVLPLLLVSCGSTTSSVLALPNTGSVMTNKAYVLGEFEDALTADCTTGALGFDIVDGNFALSYEEGKDYAGTINEMTLNYDLKDFDLVGGIVGLNEESDVSKINGSLSLSSEQSFSYSYRFVNESMNLDKDISNSFDDDVDMSCYFDADYFYYDFAQALEGKIDSSITSFSFFDDDEYQGKLETGIESSSLPLIDEEDFASIEDFLFFGQDGIYRDHGDGIYSYSDSLSLSEIETFLDNQKDFSFSLGSLTLNSSFDISDDSFFSYALVFDQDGLVSFGTDAKLEFEQGNDITDETSSEKYQDYAFLSLDFDFKANFYNGEEVVVDDTLAENSSL